MGSSAALLLARQRGVRVRLCSIALLAPFEGASRWNEGKIHLGYLYGGDPSLATARRLLPGGLRFRALTEQLIGCSLDGRITERGDVYLVHRRSVVDASSAGRYFAAVNELTRRHDAAHRYLVDVSTAAVEELSADELATSYNTAEIVAGFRVPEHSVQTGWVADRFVDALTASSIDLRLDDEDRRSATYVAGRPIFVETQDGGDGPYDAVINALWDGRLRVDASIDLPPPASYSHRFRLALFLRTHSPVALPSTVVATGPFGDVKNYTGRDLYVSWYPAGLIAEGQGVDPPSVGQITVDVRDSGQRRDDSGVERDHPRAHRRSGRRRKRDRRRRLGVSGRSWVLGRPAVVVASPREGGHHEERRLLHHRHRQVLDRSVARRRGGQDGHRLTAACGRALAGGDSYTAVRAANRFHPLVGDHPRWLDPAIAARNGDEAAT